MSIWFTADTHFGHSMILKLANRPFDSTDEMDEFFVYGWNSSIAPKDDVYHLGDVSFHNSDKTDILLSRLNGHIHVIAGNHDKKKLRNMSHVVSFENYKKLRWEGQKIILSHYPFRVWDGCHRGAWHLHGHCHGNLIQAPYRIYDVGVDNNNYLPISMDELKIRMDKIGNQPQEDHHTQTNYLK